MNFFNRTLDFKFYNFFSNCIAFYSCWFLTRPNDVLWNMWFGGNYSSIIMLTNSCFQVIRLSYVILIKSI